MHRPDPDTGIDETLSALSDLVRGKVRAIGSSTFPAEQIVEAQWVAQSRGHVRFRCERPPYSILLRGIEGSVLPTCQKYGMGVIAWSPLASDWLTGRIRESTGVDMTKGRAQRIPQRLAAAGAGRPRPQGRSPSAPGRPRRWLTAGLCRVTGPGGEGEGEEATGEWCRRRAAAPARPAGPGTGRGP